MERSAIRDPHSLLPVFRYAPYGLRAGVWNEGHDHGREDTRTEPEPPFTLQRHPRDRLHRIFVRDMPAVRRFHEDVLAFPRHILQKVPSEIRELFTLR
jgi:hypothetical protein